MSEIAELVGLMRDTTPAGGWTPQPVAEPKQKTPVVDTVVSVVSQKDDMREGRDEPLAEILDHVKAFVRRYVVLNDVQADALALWIAHTYIFESGRVTPYAYFTSAEAASGKTTALEVCEVLVPRPLQTMNISDAALFRVIEAETPTLLFDEVDAVFGPKARDREDLRALLNSGYKRGGTVLRMGGPQRDRLDKFTVYCPKALAGLGQLPDTTASRTIRFELKRRKPDEPCEDFFPEDIEAEATAMRGELEAWAAEAADTIEQNRPRRLDGLDPREQECWRILIAVADNAGDRWPVAARAAAHGLSRTGTDSDTVSRGVQLLADIQTVFGDRDRMFSEELVSELNAREESPWGDYGKGAGLSKRTLAAMLKPFGVKPREIRVGTETRRGYTTEGFADTFARYLSHNDVLRNKRNTDGAVSFVSQERGMRKAGAGLPDGEVRRLLDRYRPELVGRNDLTTPDERREIANMLRLYERTQPIAVAA